MKKIIASIFGFTLLFIGQTAFASSIWNNASNDCSDIAIANYTTNTGYGSPCWSGTNINANPGDTINVRVYYHNTDGPTATNTRIKVFAPTGSSTSHSFSAQILSTAPNGNLYSSNVNVSLPSSQSLTYVTTKWFPNQSTTSASLLNGQSGSEVLGSNGLYIGDIAQGGSTQGTVVVAFKVGSTQTIPVCSIDNFTANPQTINQGGSSNLIWNTTGCMDVRLNNNQTSLDGSQTVTPTTTTTYTLKAYNRVGTLSATKNVTVTVNTPTPTACSLVSLSAEPATINAGGSSTIFWNTVNCSNVKLNGVSVNTWGSKLFSNIQSNTTYTLTGNSSNGTAHTKTVTVVVNNTSQNCTLNTFTANPSTITVGQASTLSWSTTNCSYVKIYKGSTLIGTYSGVTAVVSPSTSTVYTAKAYSSSGVLGGTKNTTVIIGNPIPQNCEINSFNAIPSIITSGQSANLSWSTTNCSYVKITSGALTNSTNYPANSSLSVSPTQTTTYTLTAYGSNGTIQTKTTKVIVNSAFVPSCLINSFTTNSTNITSGQSANLSWNTTNCATVSLNGSEVSTSGSKVVWPTQTTTYTLIAQGANGITQTKNVTIYVNTIVFDNCGITKLSANPTSITAGGSSLLSWSTKNCNNVTLNGNEVPFSGSKTVWPVVTTTYTLVASGLNGGVTTQSVTVYVNTVIPNYCTINNFSASPTSIISGSSSLLSYSTSDCLSVSIVPEGGYNLPASGTKIVWPTQTTTYILTAQGANGLIKTQSVTVYVNTVAPDYCIINDFSASPTSIISGNSSTLYWNTTNCTNVTLNGDGVSNSGSKTVWPTHTTTYTLNAYGTNGMAQTRSVTVYVNQINNDTCEIINFQASDTSIEEGDYSILSWNTNNCDYVKITALGNVDDDGSEKVYPTSDKTYTLTAYDFDGGNQTDTVTIYVDDDNNNNSDCSIDSFTASDTYIQRGDDVTLRWRTTDCDDVSISEIGNVDDDGSETVSPRSNTTYTLRAYGDGGSDSDSIRINVDYDNDNGYYNPPVYNTNVITTIATNITQNSAQINGLITSSSYDNATTYFEYGTSVNLGLRTSSRTTGGNNNFSEYLTNLNPKTIYYFRAVGEGQNGLSRGAIEVFQTLGYVNTNNNVQTIRQIVYQQGPTISGSESPIVLRIENRYQTLGVGDIVDYTVFYKNISSSTLTNPMVQVFIPQGMTFTNSSRGTYSQENKTLSIPIQDLRPDDEGVLYLQTRVDSIDPNMAQIVTTAVLIYTNPNGAQENAMAYVLNNPKINNLLGASAFFGNIFGMGLIGWLLLIILIMIIILISRTYGRRNTVTTTTHKTIS